MAMRRLFRHDAYMATWGASAIASIAIPVGVGIMHFMTSAATRPAAERAFAALTFSATTFSIALVCGVLVWGVARLVRGSDSTLGMMDTVLWVAAVIATLFTASVMFR